MCIFVTDCTYVLNPSLTSHSSGTTKLLQKYYNNFQEQGFLRDSKFPPFSPALRSREEKGGAFESRKQSCSLEFSENSKTSNAKLGIAMQR